MRKGEGIGLNRKTLALVMLVITLALMPPVAMGAEGTPGDCVAYGANTVCY